MGGVYKGHCPPFPAWLVFLGRGVPTKRHCTRLRPPKPLKQERKTTPYIGCRSKRYEVRTGCNPRTIITMVQTTARCTRTSRCTRTTRCIRTRTDRGTIAPPSTTARRSHHRPKSTRRCSMAIRTSSTTQDSTKPLRLAKHSSAMQCFSRSSPAANGATLKLRTPFGPPRIFTRRYQWRTSQALRSWLSFDFAGTQHTKQKLGGSHSQHQMHNARPRIRRSIPQYRARQCILQQDTEPEHRN